MNCYVSQIKLEDAEQKKTVAEGIAENVSREKAVVEVETAKAQVQAEQVAKTQAEVSRVWSLLLYSGNPQKRAVRTTGVTICIFLLHNALYRRRQVSVKQRDTEADLAKAEPAVAAAMAALDTLNKKASG